MHYFRNTALLGLLFLGGFSSGVQALSLELEGGSLVIEDGSVELPEGVRFSGTETVDVQAGQLIFGSGATFDSPSATSHLVTSGTGTVRQTVGSTAVLFPIGSSATSYTPITLTESGTSDTYDLRVRARDNSSGSVDREWYLSEGTSGGGNLSVTVQWNAAEEASSFDRSGALEYGLSNGNDFTSVAISSSVSGSDPYTLSFSGVSTPLSSLAVGNGDALAPFYPPPVASSGSASLLEDSDNATLSASDFGLSGSITKIRIDVLPTLGTLQYLQNGATWVAVTVGQEISVADLASGFLRYLPPEDANGSGLDSLSFSVYDGTSWSVSPAALSFNVTAVEDAPVATGGQISVLPGQSYSSQFTAVDADNDTLTFSIAVPPTIGTLTLDNASTGEFTFSTPLGASGSDNFTFTVTDNTSRSDNGTYLVSINNDPQAGTPDLVSVGPGRTVSGTLTGTDADDDSLTFAITVAPTQGTATLDNASTGAYRYTAPAQPSRRTDNFTFSVNDGRGGVDTGTVRFAINRAPTPPTLAWPKPGALMNRDVVFSISESLDLDNDELTYTLFVCQNNQFTGCPGDVLHRGTAWHEPPSEERGWGLAWASTGGPGDPPPGTMGLAPGWVLAVAAGLLLLALLMPRWGGAVCSTLAVLLLLAGCGQDLRQDPLGAIESAQMQLDPGKYYWKVKVEDTYGLSAESLVQSFEVK